MLGRPCETTWSRQNAATSKQKAKSRERVTKKTQLAYQTRADSDYVPPLVYSCSFPLRCVSACLDFDPLKRPRSLPHARAIRPFRRYIRWSRHVQYTIKKRWESRVPKSGRVRPYITSGGIWHTKVRCEFWAVLLRGRIMGKEMGRGGLFIFVEKVPPLYLWKWLGAPALSFSLSEPRSLV